MRSIFLSQWNATRLHGPGPKLTIMSRPREWEHGAGFVPYLTPPRALFDAVFAGEIGMDAYRWRYERLIALRTLLQPGILEFNPGRRSEDRDAMLGRGTPVLDGATLCCACSIADADAGRCHRAWAAEALHAAGWRVFVDGRDLGAPSLFG